MNRPRKFASPLLIPLLLAAACGDQGASQPEEASRLEVLERAAVVASRGGTTTLDVANWNVEWFGDTGHGPTDESLQLANVRDTILGGDVDVWGLEEVVSNSAFNGLESQLPGYAGFISNESSVTDGSAYYSSTEQKLGILYKTSVASLVSARVILTQNDHAFAGRPPLEVKLNVMLNGVTEERVFIVVHMKAYDDGESWQRRQNASAALKSYLDATYPTQKVFVIGDFNDDLDTSITAGQQSPYENFVADSSRYDFPSWTFSQNQIGTTCSYPDAVDHQLNTNEQYADLVPGSVEVYRVDQQISSYCTTTSDHYPVLARYSFGTGLPQDRR